MKQKALLLAVLITTFFLAGCITRADEFMPSQKDQNPQETPKAVLIASVSIANATVVLQEDGSLSIAFDLANKEGVQVGIRYGVDLVIPPSSSENVPYLYDEHVYPETLTLGVGQVEHKNVTYAAPLPANGKYQVWVVAKNDSGLQLGQNLAGEVELHGQGGVNIQTNSCFLSVSGEDKKYTLSQGVDVSSFDTMRETCLAQNVSNENIEATIQLGEFRRNAFTGNDGAQRVGPTFSFKPQEEKMITFDIPINKDSQAYDVVAYLSDVSGIKTSNNTVAHYVSQGKSATLANVRFDKSSYLKGDIAHVTLFITPSADRFNNSRGKGSLVESTFAVAEMTSASSGAVCSEKIEIKVDSDQGGVVTKDMPVFRDCFDPEAKLSIIGDGDVLDEKSYELTSGISADSKNRNGVAVLLLSAAGFIVFVTLFIIFVRRRNRSVAVFLALLFGQWLGVVHQARADSFTVPGGPYWDSVTNQNVNFPSTLFSVDFNRYPRIYSPGDQVVMTASVTGSTCLNGVFDAVLNYGNNTGNSGQLLRVMSNSGGYYGGFSQSFTAPMAPGTYYVAFEGITWGAFHGSYTTSYQVQACSPSSWSPDPSTVCSGQPFTQTSNCNTTRSAVGTKNCSCVPNCSAAPSYCSGTSFSNGCGGTCWGTKNCSCVPNCSAAPSYCSGTSFSNGCGGTCWGTGYCPPPPASPTLNLTVKETANAANTASNGGAITIPNGTSATLSWTTTNATSCMAVTSVPNETWNSGGVTNNSSGVSVGPLATRSTAYRYTLWCSGGGGSITQTVFVNVSAPLTVTVSGRIYNQTTGIGYGAASGVKIAACGSNPGTVVNADGTYSFQVPVGPTFCIRLTDASGNPFVPTGASGSPKTVFTDPVRSWISSYEHQVGGQDCTTGSHCGDPVTSPDDGPSLWDRAVDTGYDFVYTSIPAPTATLDVNPSVINIHSTANQKATLTWGSSGNVTSCSGTNFNTGGAKSGTIQNLQPGSTTTYTVLCAGPGGNSLPVSKTLTVISVCNPDSTCGGTRSNVCTDKTCTDVCGNHYDGTKDCREFWKEVAP